MDELKLNVSAIMESVACNVALICRVLAIAICLCSISLLADTPFVVKNVAACQRYPWNGKVDVDFVLESSDTTTEYNVSIECIDLLGRTNLTLKTLRYDNKGEVLREFRLKGGKHRVTWDADVDCPNTQLSNISFSVFAKKINDEDVANYLIIDLSGGASASSYSVSYMKSVPSSGWTDEYKSNKLVMRRCPAGVDPHGKFTLTKDFFAGVFEVTQKQWFLVMGESPSGWRGAGDTYPVYEVSYDDIRGAFLGANWPSSSSVDARCFIGMLRQKTGLHELDLPTIAQRRYACLAGKTTPFSTRNMKECESSLSLVCWFSSNSNSAVHPVGQKTPNDWGLYDMYGNVSEWCLDFVDNTDTGLWSEVDPWGPASGMYRGGEGGGWNDSAFSCLSAQMSATSTHRSESVGFRIFRTMP